MRDVVLTRTLHAPRALVWKAWTEPDRLAHWWGPDGCCNTTHEMNVRPGGVWRFTMHGPDGTDYQARQKMVEFGAIEGGNQTLARLDHYLAKERYAIR